MMDPGKLLGSDSGSFQRSASLVPQNVKDIYCHQKYSNRNTKIIYGEVSAGSLL